MDQHTTLGRINRSFPRHNVVVQFQGRTSHIRDTVGLEFSDEFVLSTLYKIRKTGWGSN